MNDLSLFKSSEWDDGRFYWISKYMRGEVNWAELLMEPWEIHVSWRENSELYLHLNYQNGLDGKFMISGAVKQKWPLSVSQCLSVSVSVIFERQFLIWRFWYQFLPSWEEIEN